MDRSKILLTFAVSLLMAGVLSSQDRGRDTLILRVYDSNGTVVGPVQGTNGNVATVSFYVQKLLFNLNFGRVQPSGTSALYYLSRDCSGLAFIEQDVRHIFPDTFVLGDTVYVEDISVAVQNLTMFSAADPPGCFLIQTGRATLAHPTIILGGFLNQFAPPFSVK
jgi:hypothetical protein